MKHYIIYIPGLGDRNDGIRRFLLRFWRVFGVRTELVPMQWNDGSPYQEKYNRVVLAIKEAKAQGFEVSIIGESAGASMAMNVFASSSSLHRMVSLCGVNSPNAPIAPHIFAKSPAFEESVGNLQASRESVICDRKDQVSSVTALIDTTVPVGVNRISHVRNIRVPSIGHVVTILLCLTIFSFVLIREIRR